MVEETRVVDVVKVMSKIGLRLGLHGVDWVVLDTYLAMRCVVQSCW